MDRADKIGRRIILIAGGEEGIGGTITSRSPYPGKGEDRAGRNGRPMRLPLFCHRVRIDAPFLKASNGDKAAAFQVGQG